MKKLFQYAIVLLCCLSADITITKSELLLQVQDLVITTKETPEQKEATKVVKNPLLPKELSKEEYDRLAFEICRDHGSEQAQVSEVVFHTLKDTDIMNTTTTALQRFSHSIFTTAATVKQLTQSLPTRTAAVTATETNKIIAQQLNQPNIYKELKINLEKIQTHEKAVLDLFVPSTDAEIIAKRMQEKSLYPWPNATKNRATVNAHNRFVQAINVCAATANVVTVFVMGGNPLKNAAYLLKFDTYKHLYNYLQNKQITDPVEKLAIQTSIKKTYLTAVTAVYAFNCYMIYLASKEHLNRFQTKQIQLIHLNHYLEILRSAGAIIKTDPKLAKAFAKELAQINDLFDPASTTVPKELRTLIENLMSSSFSGEPSYWFSKMGKIIITSDQVEAHKHLLVPYFEILGKIDAHFAAASLYNANKKEQGQARMCLPEVKQQNAPYIKAVACWHPMIDPKIAVSNNVFMGTEEHAPNLIITGPNAGGKTTFITAITTNIYLSQHFGIAYADSFTFTPFSHIVSALDVTTDLSKNQSLFKAEAARARMIKSHALASNADCLVFSAIDEPFNGTRADIASNIAYKYLDSLGNCPFHMTIVTTHFPELTQLEAKTGHFTNMKVDDATIHADGKITYPFTINRGISTQNIAEAILISENVL
jgi:hypothetical protein